MKPEITRSSWDDLIFESRNKEYGAYSIRKSYDDNIAKGFFVALILAAFVFGVIQVAAILNVKIEVIPPTVKVPDVIFPPVIIPDPPVVEQKLISGTKSNPNFFPVATTQQPIETPLVEPINPSTNLVGDETSTTQFPTVGNDPGGVVEPTTVTVKPVEIFNGAEVMPEYTGGTKAMLKFLGKNLHYPASARSIGQEGTVYVRFVVNAEGKVVDVEIVKGVSAVLDQEAMRVVALMSKWKPGMQHNLPVNVRMVLPVSFRLANE
jgi:periplasmic protein TonB